MKTVKLAATLLLFFGIALLNQSYAQTTIWKFDAADNSGRMVQITSNGEGIVTKVEMATKGDAAWTAMTIQHVDDYQEYFRVQSVATSKVYEIRIYWDQDKLVRTAPDGVELTYWLRKS
jgi:hypothetical protein